MVLAIFYVLCILFIVYSLMLVNSNNVLEPTTQTAMEAENRLSAMTIIINQQLIVIVGDCGGIIASLINQIIIIMKRKK